MIVAHSEHRIVVEDSSLALGLAAGRVVQVDAGGVLLRSDAAVVGQLASGNHHMIPNDYQ